MLTTVPSVLDDGTLAWLQPGRTNCHFNNDASLAAGITIVQPSIFNAWVRTGLRDGRSNKSQCLAWQEGHLAINVRLQGYGGPPLSVLQGYSQRLLHWDRWDTTSEFLRKLSAKLTLGIHWASQLMRSSLLYFGSSQRPRRSRPISPHQHHQWSQYHYSDLALQRSRRGWFARSSPNQTGHFAQRKSAHKALQAAHKPESKHLLSSKASLTQGIACCC